MLLCRPALDYSDQPFRSSPEDWEATLCRDGYARVVMDFAEVVGEAEIDLRNLQNETAVPPGTDVFLADKSGKVITYLDFDALIRAERAYTGRGDTPVIRVCFMRICYQEEYELALRPVNHGRVQQAA